MRSIEERIARRGDEGAMRGSWSREEGSGRRRRCRTQEVDDADPWMSEVADRESLRARRPSPDLTSVRGCLHRLSSSTDGGVDAGSRAGAGAGAGMRRLRTSGDSSCTGGD